MNTSSKLIVFSCGGKGGVGKTTVATSVADYYATRGIAATLFDCDTENKQRGSLSHFFPSAEKLDIRAERGLDRFVDIALAADARVALADLAARLKTLAGPLFARLTIAIADPPRVLPERDGAVLTARFRAAIGV